MYFQATIKHNVEQEDGFLKKVNELYLFDALTYTDAETQAYKFAEVSVHGEFSISGIKTTRINDVVVDEQEHKFWLVKYRYQTVDGDSEKIKMINYQMLVNCDTIQEVTPIVEEFLKQMLVPYEVYMIQESKIVEFIPYEKDEQASDEA